MLALAVVEADIHSACGGFLSETTAVDEWGRPLHRYETPPPARCWRCSALTAEQEKHREKPYAASLVWSVTGRRADAG